MASLPVVLYVPVHLSSQVVLLVLLPRRVAEGMN